jgi:glutathione S-transferase
MIHVYGHPASRAFRTLWMLEELGLEYEHTPTHFATGETRKPGFLKLNPNGHIPVIREGSLVLWESMAINLYLASKYGREGLWPGSVEEQGLVTQWSFWCMTEAETLLLETMMHRLLLPESERDAARADECVEKLQAPLAVLDAALEGKPHLLGDGFTVADLNVAAVMSWARLGQIDLSAWPNVSAWLGRCLDRAAARKARGG